MFDEQTLEKVTMKMLEELEYECINGYEMKRADFSKVLLEDDLVQAIGKINKGIKDEQIQEAVRLIRNNLQSTYWKEFLYLFKKMEKQDTKQ